MGMTGFFCQDDYLEKTAKLTDTELGQLFRALMAYHKTGEITELEGRGEMAFDFIKTDIDRDEKAYQKKCDQARANRLKGTEQTLTDVNERQPPSTDVNGSEQYNINKNKKEKENKELSDRFDRFWIAYPRKVAKPDARKKFEKLNPDEALLETMLAAIEKQKRSDQWQRDGGQFIPHPSTWLNQRRWEDEVTETRVPVARVTAQGYTQRDYAGEQEDALVRMLKGVGA